MARIPRKFLKVFASGASNNGQFGSGALGTKVLSSDVEVLQGLSAWLNGWLPAVIGTKKFPALEEFQSVMYVLCTNIAYQYQEGISEWNTDTTYYQFSIVKQTGTYRLYGSLVDDNTGNLLTDATKWVFLTDLSATIAQATESVAGIAKIATVAQVQAGTDDQTFITPLKAVGLGLPTGAVIPYAFSTLPANNLFIYVSGKTIGNASSGGTNRANADTVNLFTGLWNSYSNTDLPIQDSSGSPTTRGVSAAADFAANKRLPTLDIRGRVIAGLDNMGGTPAGRLTGQPGGVAGTILGAAGGEEKHVLIISEIPPHVHDLGDVLNAAAYSASTTSGITSWTVNVGNTHTASTGGGGPHNNVQPTIVLPYLIRL